MKFIVGRKVLVFRLFPTLLVLVLLPILISLGFWQLNRAEEKQRLLGKMSAGNIDVSIELHTAGIVDPETVRYRKVIAAGHYDRQHQFLLDNRIVDGKVGYYVLTPFILAHGSQAVLVNRGWVAMPSHRSNLPDISFHGQEKTVSGRINLFPAAGIKLNGAEIPGPGWPSVLQHVDPDLVAERLGYRILPYQVELDPEQSEGYIRSWQKPVSMTPEKHQAYAFQWFALALTLFVLFALSIGKEQNHE